MQWSKEKQKERERKNKRSSVTGRMQLWLSLTLESSKNFFHQHHPSCATWCQTFYSSNHGMAGSSLKLHSPKHCALKSSLLHCLHPSLQPIMNGWSQRCTVFGKLYHGSANNASMSHAPSKLGRGIRRAGGSLLFCLGWKYGSEVGETTGENQSGPPGSCGWPEEEALIKAALNHNQEFISVSSFHYVHFAVVASARISALDNFP